MGRNGTPTIAASRPAVPRARTPTRTQRTGAVPHGREEAAGGAEILSPPRTDRSKAMTGAKIRVRPTTRPLPHAHVGLKTATPTFESRSPEAARDNAATQRDAPNRALPTTSPGTAPRRTPTTRLLKGPAWLMLEPVPQNLLSALSPPPKMSPSGCARLEARATMGTWNARHRRRRLRGTNIEL